MTTFFRNPPEPFSAAVFVAGDSSARRLSLQIARIAPHFRIALLTGERGTGKLTIANEMHRLSPAAAGRFTRCDATAFAACETRQAAYRAPGTLYLEGVDRVPLNSQAALLERLDSIARHLRVVIGSECDLRGLVASGRMQQPLFERVGALAIRLIPLRERRDSIDAVAGAMLNAVNPAAWFSQQALARLREHGWKANLQELWEVVQQIPSATGEISAGQLALQCDEPGTPPALRLDEVIELHVMDVVQRCAGNKLRAAEMLGISRSTLYRMLDSATYR